MKNAAKFFTLFLIVLLVAISLAGCDLDTSSDSSDTSDNGTTVSNDITTGEITTQEEWDVLIDFNGSFSGDEQEADSNIFELPGGEFRVTYDISTATKNETVDSGTSLIYILPEGYTKTQNPEGNLDVAVQDITVIGSKTGEQETLEKEAGKYHIIINTFSVESYRIVVEVKK